MKNFGDSSPCTKHNNIIIVATDFSIAFHIDFEYHQYRLHSLEQSLPILL